MRTIKARGAEVNVGNGPEVDLIDNDGDVWRYNSNDNTYTVETGNVPFSWRNLLGIEDGELDFYVLEETSVWGVGDELYNSIDWLDAEVEAARTVFDERVDAGQDADKTLAAWVRLQTRMEDLRKARDLQAEYVLGLTTPLDTP